MGFQPPSNFGPPHSYPQEESLSPTPQLPPVETGVARSSGVDLLDVLLILMAAVCAIVFSVLAGTAAIYIAHYPHSFDPKELGENALFVIPMQMIAYLLVVGFMAGLVWMRHQQGLWEAIGWNMPSERLAMAALAMGGVLGLFSEVSSTLLQRWTPKTLPIEQLFRDPSSGYLLAGFGVLVAPLVEELFFRGFLYPAVARWTGPAISIIFTAGAFAALHGAQLAYAWPPLLVLFIVGMVFTLIRARTGSVATCVMVHVGYNLTLFIMLFVLTGGFHHMERG